MVRLRGVLSLFDGISAAKVALDRAGIPYERYYASEIDKYAIAVARYNHPDIIFVGDIRNLKGEDFKDIDLIIGGSPCQDFSFAGKQRGMVTKTRIEVTTLEQYLELKEAGFEFEGQSYLFWEYVRLLKEIKPRWFLLENVKMAKKWRDVITNALGVEPIEINSALVSAQNRVRYYWTNIPVKGLPKDKGLLLKDILEENVGDKYFLKNEIEILDEPKGDLVKVIAFLKGINYEQTKRIISILGKSHTLTNMRGGNTTPKIVVVDRDKSLCLTSTYYKGVKITDYFKKSRRQIVFSIDGNSKIRVRKLTPLECERLQTFPDGYTEYGLFDNGKKKKMSDTQRYRLLGNAFTVDVIVWILSHLKEVGNGE